MTEPEDKPLLSVHLHNEDLVLKIQYLWVEPEVWGIALADILRNVAVAYAGEDIVKREKIEAVIWKMMRSEMHRQTSALHVLSPKVEEQ
jgi:hypothetical protein